ncbi:hypothetical protein BGW41_005682 [Actinomortierella wolfii]|nr:hypothetical protein BGW41_005682 [Actinomortierella wolfii]
MLIPPPQLTGPLLRQCLLSHASKIHPVAPGPLDSPIQANLPAYHVLGRIIHKRKLSKKLFFLDVAFVQLKQPSLSENSLDAIVNTSSSSSSSEAEGIRLSHWHEEQVEQEQDEDITAAISTPKKLEVIAKVPQHTLAELDTLWHSVQLGSVAKITGHLEISERKAKKNQSTSNDALQQPKESETKQWAPILHCSTIEIVEPWLGNDSFQPIPGSAEIHTSSSKNQRANQQHSQGHKRTAAEAGLETRAKDVKDESSGEVHDIPTRQHCKFWLNSGKCHKENCELWHEKDITKLKLARRQWVEERIQTKRQISHHVDDPHRSTTKNQHRERSLHFAKWLIDTFSRDFLASGRGVLDIAGGRGDLSFELQTRQGIPSTIIDPKPDKGFRKWQRRWVDEFKKKTARSTAHETLSSPTVDKLDKVATTGTDTPPATSQSAASVDADMSSEKCEDEEGAKMDKAFESFVPTRREYPLQTTEPTRIQAMMDDALVASHHPLFEEASILVGLHPDQATEPIVRMALRLRKPFAVIPCCVFSRDNPHRRLPRLEGDSAEKSGGSTDPCKNSDEEKQGDIASQETDSGKEELTRPVTSYDDFVQWLMTLHPGIETTWLNFEGMNRVVYWRGQVSQRSQTGLKNYQMTCCSLPSVHMLVGQRKLTDQDAHNLKIGMKRGI